MKLLHAIYAGPKELLSKAEADGDELVRAIDGQDKVRARAALFNFAITTYHVWDWVKAHRPDLKGPATNALKRHESLAVCRDLANASKHATIEVTRKVYREQPPVVRDVAVSAVASSLHRPTEAGAVTRWRFKVQLASGRRLAAEDLVIGALSAWKNYFAQHSIK